MSVPIVPIVPGGGNTSTPPKVKKQVSPSKKWCFTLNNYTDEDVKSLSSSIVPIKRMMFQSEVGLEGTPHLQGWLEFKTKKRPKSVYSNKSIHWEKMKGTIQDNITYCSKSDTYDGKVRFALGCAFPYLGPQIELTGWEKTIVDILKKPPVQGTPEFRNIYWVWEPDGNFGKTTFAKWIYHNLANVIVTEGKVGDMKNGVAVYFQAHGRTPEIVLIDIPRVNSNHFSVAGIESIKNMFFYSGKYEGGMVSGPRPHVVVFSNAYPPIEKMSTDKWKIMDLREDEPEFRSAY